MLLENRAADERRLENPPGDVDAEALQGCVECFLADRLGTKDEVVIKTDSMFAKNIVPTPPSLCPFLQEMDREEETKQETEQQEIQKAKVHVKARINLLMAKIVRARS